MNYETTVYKEENNIAYIIIDMPPANKMIPEFLKEIVSVIEDNALKTTMSGIIITGNGRHFSSGADVKKLMQLVKETTQDSPDEEYVPEWYMRVKNAFDSLYKLRIPVVAAINGLCIGSGFELALHSHLLIAEANSRVGLPETSFGLLPGIDGTIRSLEKIGYKKAFSNIVRAELLSAEDALACNLVDIIVPKKESVQFAQEIIHFIAEKDCEYKSNKAVEEMRNYIKTRKE